MRIHTKEFALTKTVDSKPAADEEQNIERWYALWRTRNTNSCSRIHSTLPI